MSYNRQLSPGSRRIVNQGRVSDSFAPQYQAERHNSFNSPRASGGVIPLGTTIIENPRSSQASNTSQRHDSYARPAEVYSGRPRRSSLVDQQRNSTSNVSALPSRTRPTVVQNDYGRPTSPQKNPRDKDYYVTPAKSNEPRKTEHKKLYSVNDGSASLVADINVPAGGERHHRRRESDGGERGGYRGTGQDRDRGRRGYHLNGPVRSQPKEKSIDDEDAFSYTDAAGMYRDTEPRWRETERRPRRNSVDRNGASRERPTSMLDMNANPRRSDKEIGPPPSTRGWAALNDGLGRARSVRERPRDVPQSPTRAGAPRSPTRARMPQSPTRGRYPDNVSRGDYYVPPRTSSTEARSRYAAPAQERSGYDNREYIERREPRHERRNSMTRAPDHSVERRGFGIRSDSQDRYGRASDESFNQQSRYRDSGYAVAEPHRRDTAPELNYHEEQRLEQEKKERMLANERLQNEDRERQQWEREAREKEERRRNEDAAYREYDQRRERDREYDVDRERERERERMMQPQPQHQHQHQPQHEHERHHHRHDSNRDREYGRKESEPRHSSESLGQPGLAGAATGGLAGAAAAYGLNKVMNKNNDSQQTREQDRRPDKPREYERERVSPRPQENLRPQEVQSHDTLSDDGRPYPPTSDRYRSDHDRGLGFAFEHAPPEPPKSAPPMRDRPHTLPDQDKAAERDFERQHEDRPAGDVHQQSGIDPDEDYRRRLEQMQRELGRGSNDQGSESDPDRERRRREREQRYRQRELRNGEQPPSSFGTESFVGSQYSSQMPGSYENGSVAGTSTAPSRPGLTRKRSILDEPMTNEPAQIIDNSQSERRENRVRIVDPPTEEEEKKPKGILKKPTEKFPEHPDSVREGVAPLKDATKSGIPPGARWTKIDRRLVNPEALEEAKERFEERLDCVIVLRVLTKEEIQKLADRTREIRDERYEEERDERHERRAAKRRDRRERDEYEDEDSEDEFKPRAPKMLEAPASATASTFSGASAFSGAPSSHGGGSFSGQSGGGDQADFINQNRERRGDREREQAYMSGGLGRRDDR